MTNTGDSPYAQGHAAGYTAAVDRETSGDAATALDGPTWFVLPPASTSSDAEAADYERGFLTGWVDYFEGRQD